MISGSSEERSRETRLDTWKSIAQYLGRSSRTAQRWHAVYGLPVLHLSGESGSVFAYSDELDDWLRRRSRAGIFELPKLASTGTFPAHSDHNATDHHNSIFDSSLISAQARVRSAQLVVIAAKMWEAHSHRNLTAIVQHYREAVDLNPGNATAHAGLAFGLIAQGIWGTINHPVAYASAKAALEAALNINSELPLAKCADAWLKVLSTRDWQGARRGFDEILVHLPSCTRSMNGRALLYTAEGRLEEASDLFLRAAQQSPLSTSSIALYCWTKYLAGEFAHVLDQAGEVRASGQDGPITAAAEALSALQHGSLATQVERLEALAAEYPRSDVLRGALGYAYAVNGQGQRARDLLDTMMNPKDARITRVPYAVALILIGLNERQRAVDCLRQSYRDGSLWSLGFRSDPILEGLRNDPHYRHLLSEFSYPEPENAAAQLRAVS